MGDFNGKERMVKIKEWIQELQECDPEGEAVVLFDNKTIIKNNHSGRAGIGVLALCANFQRWCNVVTEKRDSEAIKTIGIIS